MPIYNNYLHIHTFYWAFFENIYKLWSLSALILWRFQIKCKSYVDVTNTSRAYQLMYSLNEKHSHSAIVRTEKKENVLYLRRWHTWNIARAREVNLIHLASVMGHRGFVCLQRRKMLEKTGGNSRQGPESLWLLLRWFFSFVSTLSRWDFRLLSRGRWESSCCVIQRCGNVWDRFNNTNSANFWYITCCFLRTSAWMWDLWRGKGHTLTSKSDRPGLMDCTFVIINLWGSTGLSMAAGMILEIIGY